MTEFENQVLSMMKNMDNKISGLQSEMNNNFNTVNKRLDKIESDIEVMKEDIEVMKEDIEITRVASNANGQKMEDLENLLKDLKVIA